MAYLILMGRRIPKQAITGFKFQNETDNIRPFLSIRIRGKDEIIPFKDKNMNPYILFKTSKFGNIKVRFPKDEDMDAELLVLDQLFDVE